MNRVDLAAARAQRWDLVIVGTSFAAMFFARHLPRPLAERGRILFVEKGALRPHAAQLDAQTIGPMETIAQRNRSDAPKDWTAHTMFGGNSNCWWACTPRLHPDDFRLNTLYGLAQDWPLTYDDLEPYYVAVEEAMDISGGGSDAYLPRSRPFPAPPHAPTLTDTALRAARPDWFAQPTARSFGRTRAKCCANGVCHLCPIDSKFTVLNGIDLFDRPNHRYLLETEARAVAVAGGRATALLVRQADGAEAEIAADLIALGANALFNTAILLRSGVGGPHLGAYLHEQLSQEVQLSIDRPNYFGGTSITGHGYALYPGPHRREAAAVLIENWNAPPLVRYEPGKWTHSMRLKLIAEGLPRAENRVVLVDDEPEIEWVGHDDYTYRGLKRALERLPEAIPFAIEAVEAFPHATTEAHIQGTTRMARSAADGVVDPDLKTFAAPNLLALGSGAFPSCSPANPTLTLAALSARAAERL